ncbi:MAG: amidohydrolase family protein [Clostridiaceae bacterium]|nr:amidohydrolase family protein [Clostridiaceae bacterium]
MSLFEIRDCDRRVYREKLEDFLPEKIFDIHTHVYARADTVGSDERTASWPARVADCNPPEDLCETYRLLFPGKDCRALIFGSPAIGMDIDAANAYIDAASESTGFPKLFLTHPQMSPDTLRDAVLHRGYKGIKVYLCFADPRIPDRELRIFDFLTKEHLAVMNELRAVVMLHIARPKRLRDEQNLADLLEIERDFPHVRLIVAHIGRAYCNADVGDALNILSHTQNMLFDFSANTNGHVMQELLGAVGSSRVFFGSDLPITRMRMRRIDRNGVYVNVIQRGMYGDIAGDPHMWEIDAADDPDMSFFLYEEILAMRGAVERLGLPRTEVENLFYRNAQSLLE